MLTETNQRQPCPRNKVLGLPDIDMTNTPTAPYSDGFSLNAALRYLPYRSFPLLLGQLDEMREQTHFYRAKWFVLPIDARIAIEEFTTFTATQTAAPGTLLWGFNFAALDGTAADFEVMVSDVCSEQRYFESTPDATALRPTTATDLYPVIYEPRLLEGFPHPKLRIEITNKTANDKRCQLLLHAAEPCSVQGDGGPGGPGGPEEVQWAA